MASFLQDLAYKKEDVKPFWDNIFLNVWRFPDDLTEQRIGAYPKPCQTSKIKRFAKIVNGFCLTFLKRVLNTSQ